MSSLTNNNAATPTGSTAKLVIEKKSSGCCGRCCGGLGGWGSFFMALSLAFSLANVIRLPRMAYYHGGGAFMVVYLVLMLLLGVPLVFLEMVLGQLCQEGATKLWRAVPLLKGVGYVKVVCSLLAGCYYPVIMSVSLFYALWTIKGPLPFTECSSALMQTEYLAAIPPSSQSTPMTTTSSQLLADAATASTTTVGPIVEKLYLGNGESCLLETFLKPPSIDPMWFGVSVTLLFLLWAFILLCVCRGIASYRASSVCLLLALIGCFSALLANQFVSNPTTVGIDRLLEIDWWIVSSFDTWYYAGIQVFLSAHIGFGNIVTCSGNIYSKNNAFWTSLIYTVANACVGIGSVILVYAWSAGPYPATSIQFDLHTGATPDLISNLTDSTTGPTPSAPSVVPQEELFVLTLVYNFVVAFSSYETRWWAVLAYAFIILSGFTSVVCIVYSASVIFVVETKNKVRWWLVTATLCCAMFITGIAFMLPERLGVVHILDAHVIGHCIGVMTALELIGFVWVYGGRTLSYDFEFVLGHKMSPAWLVLWYIAPLFLIAIELWSIFGMAEISPLYEANQDWIHTSGWIVYGVMWLFVIVFAVWQVCQQVDYNVAQKFMSSLKPSRKWGPVDPIYRHGWVRWRDQWQTTGRRDFTLKRRGTKDYTHSIARASAEMSPSGISRPSSVLLSMTQLSASPNDQRRYDSCRDASDATEQQFASWKSPKVRHHLRPAKPKYMS